MLIYIHSKSNDETSLRDVLDGFDRPYYSFNAPFPYKNGYMWFDRDEKGEADKKMLAYSLEFILKKIKNLIEKEKLKDEDITFIGHSQGGVMAVLVSEHIKASKIITLAADVFPGIDIKNKNIQSKIYWLEGENDTKLNENRKESVNRLIECKYNVEYSIVKGVEHSKFPKIIVEEILDNSSS